MNRIGAEHDACLWFWTDETQLQKMGTYDQKGLDERLETVMHTLRQFLFGSAAFAAALIIAGTAPACLSYMTATRSGAVCSAFPCRRIRSIAVWQREKPLRKCRLHRKERLNMKSIRSKFMLLTVCTILIALGIATWIGVTAIRELGRNDADEMLHLTSTTGAMHLENYFESVEQSVETVSTLVQDSFDGMPYEELEAQVENVRNLFIRIAYHTNGVLTYYFRIDPCRTSP